MIDVIIPIYQKKKSKRLKYLHLAIQGIINQTYKNWKLCLIDDCSPYEVFYDIKPYLKDKRIIYHRNLTNLLLPTTLNHGHSFGEGEWCMWNCDDDWKEPTFMEEMLAYMKNQKLDLCRCLEALFFANLKPKEVFDPRKDPGIAGCTEYMGMGHLYKRKVWEKLEGYDKDLFCIEDLDFIYRAKQAGFKIGFLKELLHNTIRHPESVTYCDSEITKQARQKFIQKWRK